jgi:hypothetical protein
VVALYFGQTDSQVLGALVLMGALFAVTLHPFLDPKNKVYRGQTLKQELGLRHTVRKSESFSSVSPSGSTALDPDSFADSSHLSQSSNLSAP